MTDHWDRFYSSVDLPHLAELSPFARFCGAMLVDSGPGILVDVACGNGRDAVFFAELGWEVVALDACEPAVAICKRSAADRGVSLTAHCCDAAGAGEHYRRAAVIYCRWGLHAVSAAQAAGWIHRWGEIGIGGMVAVEARAADPGGGDRESWADGHYRRLIDPLGLRAAFERMGFAPVHLEIGRGLSPIDGDDPRLVRIIVRKL